MPRQYIKWGEISWIPNLPDNFVLKYKRKLHFDAVFIESKMKEETLEKLCHLFEPKDWYGVWDSQHVSEEFIERHIDNIDWERVSCCQILSEDFIRRHIDKVDWEGISLNQDMSEEFVREFWSYIDKEIFFNFNNKVSNNFIREMRDKHKKEVATISGNGSVDTNIFQEFKKEINWDELIAATCLTEEQILKWRDYFSWQDVIEYQRDISSEFVKKFLRGVKSSKKWKYTFEYKKFDEEFIEKFMSVPSHNKDQKMWDTIWHSQSKILSENFIRKHIDKIKEKSWKWLIFNENFSSQFYIDFADKIEWNKLYYSSISDEVIEKCDVYVAWREVDCSDRSLDFILKYWDKINKADIWSNWEYVKYILGYEDESTNADN